MNKNNELLLRGYSSAASHAESHVMNAVVNLQQGITFTYVTEPVKLNMFVGHSIHHFLVFKLSDKILNIIK